MSALRAIGEIATGAVVAGLIMYNGVVYLYGNDYPELHYNGNVNGENVQFSESAWPWKEDRSTLEVKKPDGTVVTYALKENRADRGFTLEEVVVKASGQQPNLDSSNAEIAVKQYFMKIIAEKTKGYR